jgi:CYTH domain-containing protein
MTRYFTSSKSASSTLESYDNEFSIDNFDIPEWFSEEVTELMKYTNNWLAYNKE